MKLFILVLALMSHQSFADSLTLTPVGVVFHGYSVPPSAAKLMPNKIDDEGRFVQLPQINLMYEQDDTLFNAAIINDCFGNTAYWAGIGIQYPFDGEIPAGVRMMIGMYGRKDVKGIQEGMPRAFQSGGMDYAVLPWMGYYHNFPINEYTAIQWTLDTNGGLTHTGLGLKYEF